MEIGQLLHNNPIGVNAPPIANALLDHIREELAQTYWNVNQKRWREVLNPWTNKNEWGESDWKIAPGMEWRPYYNWGGCPEDNDWDQAEADKPNFSFEGVEFRWYKRYGRSLNVNVVWSAQRWAHWHERALQTISTWGDKAHEARTGIPSYAQYPNPEEAVGLEPNDSDLRYMNLMGDVRKAKAQLNVIACICYDAENRTEIRRVDPNDWRMCHEIHLVTQLAEHAKKNSKLGET